MATKLPRIAITVPAATGAALTKLALLQSRPRSTLVTELLVEMTPTLERIARLMELAVKNRGELPLMTAGKMEALAELLQEAASAGMNRAEAMVGKKPKGDARQARKGRRRPGNVH